MAVKLPSQVPQVGIRQMVQDEVGHHDGIILPLGKVAKIGLVPGPDLGPVHRARHEIETGPVQAEVPE